MTDAVDTDALKLLGLNLHGVNMTKEGVLAVRAANEIDRLRAVIENAPHDDNCARWNTDPPAPCTCWKADVL